MSTLMQWVAGVVTFVLAAKAHGRELRLEREAAGVLRVVFGGDNPALVEALWSAERLRFWVATPVLAVTMGVALSCAGASRSTIAQASLLWTPVAVFMVLGLCSLLRAGGMERGGLMGSVVWWALVVASMGLVAWLGRRAGF